MNSQYIFYPKNPNLQHCSDSLLNALKSQADSSIVTYSLPNLDLKTIWYLLRQIVKSESSDRFLIFFLAIQSDYLVLLCLVKLFARVFFRTIRVCYLMHEPRVDKWRVSSVRASIISAHQFLFGHLADIVILPSDEAVSQAKSFIKHDKIRKINLTFVSISQEVLERNLQQLKFSWNNRKTFSMLGTVSSLDKNPQGFFDFANIFNQLYPERAQFIRGGRDRNVHIQYDENLIIRFPSYLSNNTKSFLFNLSHFIVIPYSYSTQSGVVAEALNYGKLLILNDIPAFSHLKGFKFAFVINFSNKDEILQCINDLLCMSDKDYEIRYWDAVNYFRANHSEEYLKTTLSSLL